MIYIYDILLNFCDCDRVYDFYEWDVCDQIENIKRIKLIHVEKKVFDDLLYYNSIIDKDILAKLFRTCEFYTSKKVKIIDYCSLFSDGERVMAIEFNSDGIPIYKSKLLIDEEEEIALLASNLEISKFDYLVKEKVFYDSFLTRKEVLIRRFLVKEIEDSYKKKKFDKLKFLYNEYFDDITNSYHDMRNKLISSMSNSLDNKHLAIYNLLISSKKKKQV